MIELFELLHGKSPSYSHSCTFGCLAYVHDHKTPKDKFRERIKLCVFLGYPCAKKGWHFYDYQDEKFGTSRDIVFVEDKFSYASMPFLSAMKDQNFSTHFNFEEIMLVNGRASTSLSTPRLDPPVAAQDTVPLGEPSTPSGTTYDSSLLENAQPPFARVSSLMPATSPRKKVASGSFDLALGHYSLGQKNMTFWLLSWMELLQCKNLQATWIWLLVAVPGQKQLQQISMISIAI